MSDGRYVHAAFIQYIDPREKKGVNDLKPVLGEGNWLLLRLLIAHGTTRASRSWLIDLLIGESNRMMVV